MISPDNKEPYEETGQHCFLCVDAECDIMCFPLNMRRTELFAERLSAPGIKCLCWARAAMMYLFTQLLFTCSLFLAVHTASHGPAAMFVSNRPDER